MKQLWEAADFVRSLHRRLRFRKLSRAPLKLLRLELRGDHAECEWLASLAERDTSSQILEDSLAVRKLLFAAMPSLSSAVFRVYRQAEPEHAELIITGTVTRDKQATDDVCSPAMRARLCGLHFWLEADVLGGLKTQPCPTLEQPQCLAGHSREAGSSRSRHHNSKGAISWRRIVSRERTWQQRWWASRPSRRVWWREEEWARWLRSWELPCSPFQPSASTASRVPAPLTKSFALRTNMMKIVGIVMALVGWLIPVVSLPLTQSLSARFVASVLGLIISLVGILGVLNQAHLKDAIWKR
jgi:hypothetical protein